MRPKRVIVWKQQRCLWPDQTRYVLRHALGTKDAELVVDGDKPTVEHPMKRSGERDTIPYRIGPPAGYRSDVCCLNLWPSTAIDQSKSTDGAAIVVG